MGLKKGYYPVKVFVYFAKLNEDNVFGGKYFCGYRKDVCFKDYINEVIDVKNNIMHNGQRYCVSKA